ncbi:MAG: hypothetical protein HZB57_13630 [Gammaproteobacteria bacterium]|nr:hypothetical protein [Gammaproteobacteria bacterium]
MKTLSAGIICLGLLLGGATASAVDTDAVIGGALGGGVGAAVGSELGGRNGAIAGSAVGAALGTAIATDGQDNQDHEHGTRVEYEDDDHDHRGPPAHAYYPPPGHVKHGKWKD